MLDLSDIHLIKTVAEQGSINKAADTLHMSQPTLSKRISRLEKQLKIELFHRNSTGMVPTAAACYLIKQSQPVQEKMASMTRHIERLASLEGGALNIGIGPIIEQLYFPEVLLSFIQQTNNIQISLQTESPDKLLDLLANGQIDIAIGPFEPEIIQQDIFSYPVQAAPVIFVARSGHPLSVDKEPCTIERLASFPVIAPTIPRNMQLQLQERQVPDFIQVTSDNYRISKAIVENSDYITAGPDLLFKEELAANQFVKIETPLALHWASYFITLSESVRTPAVSKFFEVFQKHLHSDTVKEQE